MPSSTSAPSAPPFGPERVDAIIAAASSTGEAVVKKEETAAVVKKEETAAVVKKEETEAVVKKEETAAVKSKEEVEEAAGAGAAAGMALPVEMGAEADDVQLATDEYNDLLVDLEMD